MKLGLLSLVLLVTGCGLLTPQAESDLAKGSAAIVCSLERIELDDPELNKICDAILAAATPQQRAAAESAVRRAQSAHVARSACKPVAP